MLLTIIAEADDTRLLKATEGLCTGAYQITITRRNEEELHGVVRHEHGVEDHVTVWAGWAVCSCPDSRHRTATCEHAIALVLYAIRHPENLPQGEGGQASPTARPGVGQRFTLAAITRRRLGRSLSQLAQSILYLIFRVRPPSGKGY